MRARPRTFRRSPGVQGWSAGPALTPTSPGSRSRLDTAADAARITRPMAPTRTTETREHPMRMAAPITGLLLSCALAAAQPSAGAQPPASAQPATETLEYAIMRNGEQIGTHRVERRRTVEVKILLITAYKFQHTAPERWLNGRLAALNSATDDTGPQHKLTAALKG